MKFHQFKCLFAILLLQAVSEAIAQGHKQRPRITRHVVQLTQVNTGQVIKLPLTEGSKNESQVSDPRGSTGEKNAKVKEGEKEERREIALWGWKWEEVNTYLVISIFLLVAALVKLAYHHTSIHNHLPESCILILLGTVMEIGLYFGDGHEYIPKFSADKFFFLLLPPIILESAYSLHDRVFFSNLGTILLYAILGTLVNVFLIGPSLFLMSHLGAFNTNIPLIECLVFSTLISAVDPVAVLAIFQEIGVNKALYFLVFGESLLNDAVVITLYNSMTIFAESDTITYLDIILGIVNFGTVSGGGLLIGLVLGALTAIITRFTEHVRVVEPMIVLVLAYASYVTAELFHFSGIIGIIGCGLMQEEYAKHNLSNRSYVTIKYFTKTVSSIADVIIFFFLGNVLVREAPAWDTTFVLMSAFFCVLYRFVSVFSLTLLANHYFERVRLINFEEQLVMAYGGLRGAIAFSLSIMLNEKYIQSSKLFVTATLFEILFTVFIMGATTKTIVKLLRVKTEKESESKMFVFFNDKMLDTLMTGIEDISQNKTYNYWLQRMDIINDKYIKWLLVKGWVSTGSQYQDIFDRVKNKRPQSIVILPNGRSRSKSFMSKNVRLTVNGQDVPESGSAAKKRNENGLSGPQTAAWTTNGDVDDGRQLSRYSNRPRVNDHEVTVSRVSPENMKRWNLVKNAVTFTARKRKNDEREQEDERMDRIKPVQGPSTVRRRNSNRRTSIIDFIRENSEEREAKEVRRTLNSALNRNSFYQLPGSIFAEEENTTPTSRKNSGGRI